MTFRPARSFLHWAGRFDPSLARLRLATRTTLTLICVALALALVHLVVPLPIAAYGVGAITAVQGAVAVRDPSARGRAITRAWCGLAGLLVVAAIGILETFSGAVHVFFLLVIFAAVWARRFGIPWNAVGMYAFMCAFIAAYLHPAQGDLAGIAIAIVLASIVAHGVRNGVLPENRPRDFATAIAAVVERVRRFDAMVGPEGEPLANRRTIVAAEAGVRDAILVADGCLPLRAESEPAEERRHAMAVALLDLQVVVGMRAGAALRAVRDPAFETRVAVRVRERLAHLRSLAQGLDSDVFVAAENADRPRGVGPQTSGPSPLVQAIQVTLASALAMGVGLILSPTRWFWAILTAFLVFTNTQSRGDTMMRGLSRAVGTLIGVVVGIAGATLLAGQPAIATGLAFACIFAAFYFLIASYATMTFFLTVAISLLYGLIGQFTPDLLLLRMEETLIGAAAGILVSFVVFPRKAGAVADEAVRAYLDRFDRLLAALAERAGGGGDGEASLLAAERALDRSYDAVVNAARSVGGPWQLQRRPGRVRRNLFRLRASAHFVHLLTEQLVRHGAAPETAQAIGEGATRLRQTVAAAAERRSGYFDVTDPFSTGVDTTPGGSVEVRDEAPHLIILVVERILEPFAGHRDALPAPRSGQMPPEESGMSNTRAAQHQ